LLVDVFPDETLQSRVPGWEWIRQLPVFSFDSILSGLFFAVAPASSFSSFSSDLDV